MALEKGRDPVDHAAHTITPVRNVRFETTQHEAEAAGLPRYDAWCIALERRYTVMPLWYWDSTKRRATYAAHIRATLEWQQKQARINAGNREFLGNLLETGRS